MPHINRVRVNNVKYNFGTQFYDDFMMRFSCKNTIYDLANGGGKSVLMLLLLQNLIPNCTLDEKQPVEKLFRTSSGSNTIHSLIEWKLDPCYQRDNFKYMTTGFCARKGKDNAEEGVKESANIEYFNYCIFYREFGDNDIKNLPLSADGERITYNGLKSYLRDLERKDHGVEVHIFERKGDYQSFISRYGLFESEWEIVRGINKTEGHVRTYFENNYKTGRKVVEDLLIEEIIQKSFNNQIGNNNDEDGMAKTLLDIKDKIVELSRRKDEINTFDKQISLMEDLSAKILSFKDYQAEKETLKSELLGKLAVCRSLAENVAKSLKDDEVTSQKLEEKYRNEDKLVSIARIIDDEKALLQLKSLVDEFAEKIGVLEREEAEARAQIGLTEAMDSYKDMKKYENLKAEVMLALDNRMRGSEDVYGEIRGLAARAHRMVAQMKVDYEAALLSSDEKAAGLQQEYERIKKIKEDADISVAVSEGGIKTLSERISQKEAALKDVLVDSGVLVAERLGETATTKQQEIEQIKEEIAARETNGEKLGIEFENVSTRLRDMQSELKMLQRQEEKLLNEGTKNLPDRSKLNSLAIVYGESDVQRLEKVIYGMYKNSIREMADLELKISSMKEYIANLSEGRYMLDGHQYRKVEEYLFNNYGEDVLYGYQWYATLSPAEQRDVAKRIPFLDYSFVIIGDFERIRQDVNLRNFSHSSYIVPVISEMILRDTRHAASTDYIVFGTKDLSFLMDAGKVEAELDMVKDDLYNSQEELKKVSLTQDVLREDYLYMLSLSQADAKDFEAEKKELHERIVKITEQAEKLSQDEKALKNEVAENSDLLKKKKELLRQKEVRVMLLEKGAEAYQEIKGMYSEKKSLEEQIALGRNTREKYADSVRRSYDKWQEAKILSRTASDSLETLKRQWQEVFAPYYMANVVPAAGEMDYEQLCVRFNGLVNAANNENSDVSDKKTLIKAYEENVDKCVRDIEKRGYSVEEIRQKLSNNSNASTKESAKIYQERLQNIHLELASLRRENDAQNAQMNRMEGGLAHARRIIEEKYGEFEMFACDNTRQFIQEHTNAMKAIKDELTALEKSTKKKNAQLGDISVIDRDIERMLKNSGVNVPEGMKASDNVTFDNLKGYETIQKDYDKLIRSEYRKKEDFAKDKRRIADMLKECNAHELADEVERSIEIPDSVAEIDEMTENIKETCNCIVLEKERVGKGIDDMERIKESFENRCIQTCANIKAELDRLPKLSKITLDNEVISMIGLSIPYIKEEFYKDRMSQYINDTVAFAESFKTDEERIQYIRGRLSWKKLFSVIVTDMNAIRLNLYKRERIKDQSRYLRYEEAVGSTGQSQGIYIQFLIAIINYISNINAAGKEVSAIGKVVFIDNPFGAAKDIYIWEPIFKLLKTNHVQLIVPARGATPAITGRFDVNYILGQKMVNGRQQTVVVDYRSQVQNEVMEYTRLEYSQESLF